MPASSLNERNGFTYIICASSIKVVDAVVDVVEPIRERWCLVILISKDFAMLCLTYVIY
jgi:hypothetical protein